MAKEWNYSFVVSDVNGKAISADMCDDFMDEFVAFVESRGWVLGGGYKPVKLKHEALEGEE